MSTQHSWKLTRRTAAAATVVVALAFAATPSSASHPVDESQVRVSADRHVCGSLHADATFREERRELGEEHACEHLEERESTAPSKAELDQAHAAAVADLASTDPATIGSWTVPYKPPTKTVGISAVLLHTGKVLIFGGKFTSVSKNTAAYVVDPITLQGHELQTPAAIFCGSVTPISDGRILSVGGTDKIPTGLPDVYLFNPSTEQWVRQPDSPLGRYYPTSTRLADGRVIVAAGTEKDGKTKNPTVELYTPPSSGQEVGTLQVVGPPHVTNFYPHQWLMPDGNLLQVDGRKDYAMNTSTWQWSPLPQLQVGNGAGSAGIMLPGPPSGSSKVMVVGGNKSGNALASTQRFDYATPSAGWKYGTPMPTTRSHMNLVQVPDGSAYGIGGNSSGLYNVGQPQTMWYNPANDSWTNMAVQTPRRAYHSTAVLLPDGRIMSAGDTGSGGGGSLIDFYSPPYLFHGPRPAITAAPSQLAYGQSFSISTSGPAVTRAVLMAPGSTTHAVEMNARHLELAVSAGAGGLTATAPGRAAIAPPGYYMLFVLTADGTPSVASWVHLG